VTTEELQQRLQAAEANLASMIRQEQVALERRLRQEGAVLTLRLLLQEVEKAMETKQTEVGGA